MKFWFNVSCFVNSSARSYLFIMLVSTDVMVEVDAVTTSMEKQLRLLNILGSKDDGILSHTLDSATLKGINLEDNIPLKKVCSSSKGSFGFFFPHPNYVLVFLHVFSSFLIVADNFLLSDEGNSFVYGT